jgi:hypothetical protein
MTVIKFENKPLRGEKGTGMFINDLFSPFDYSRDLPMQEKLRDEVKLVGIKHACPLFSGQC